VTETIAIVLHSFEYRETSRIVRLATRDAGVVSVIARGARRPKSRFGQGLDLFTSGAAQLVLNPSKDLHTLAAFDATRARPALAGSLRRFGAAAALGELCLRFGTEAGAGVHDALVRGLDALETAVDDDVPATALSAGWRIVAELGFAPELESCALCQRAIAPEEEVRFAHRSGGAVCQSCRRRARPCSPGSVMAVPRSSIAKSRARIRDSCASSSRSTLPTVARCAPSRPGRSSMHKSRTSTRR
jgi:DNA repair protein RecO (recombination protein O)